MQQDNRLYLLVARKLAGEATDEELRDLQELMGADFDKEYLYEMLSAYWKREPDALSADDDNAQEVFNRIIRSAVHTQEGIPEAQIQQEYDTPALFIPVQRKSWKQWMYAAAAVIIGGALWMYAIPEKHTAGLNEPVGQQVSEVRSQKGSRSTLILPDGSKVWLNADSRLTYHNSFNNSKREVELEGEAFFDVVKDASRPFIVHTSGIDVKVLGTSFNVKSYPGDGTIEATLIRGMIEVVRKNNPSAPKTILRPHEKLVFNKELSTGSRPAIAGNGRGKRTYAAERDIAIAALPKGKADSLISETSWRYNKLIFEGDTFRQLADKLERWYDVKISIRDEKLLHYRFKGIFENETIQQALLALQLTNHFRYKINDNEIEIFK
ncbi:FecR family protein [Agriterribacter sp.]|uniref:FecR family protein n=1 Tax=Agriterribacter sp. TaxID=2821509 RepID=UPI002C349DD1|nr:FecR family protein [Agriterribacter sp.]HTN07108.1 FecR family protein [Agriterribacter sp.]